MSDNTIKIDVAVRGVDAQAVQTETARRMHATSAAMTGPGNTRATGMIQADARRAALDAANATGRPVHAGWRVGVEGPTGQTDPQGNPVMGVIGTISGREVVQPAAVAARLRTFKQGQAAQKAAALQEVKEEAAAHRIRFVDHFGGRWRAGSIERLLTTAHANPDSPEGKDALRQAGQMTAAIQRGTRVEYGARRGEAKRTDLLDRLTEARGSIDVSRASGRVQRMLRDVDQLADDVRNARRTTLATPEGRARLRDLGASVTLAEGEARRQTQAANQAAAQATRQAATNQRNANMMETAGRVMGIRAAVSGLQGAAAALASGNAVQAGGGLVHTVGATMHHVGLGRMAAARTMGATGAAAGAGRLLTGLGSAVMVGAKFLTAGLERGYENSQRADNFMSEAEPMFDLRARQYAVAQGSRGTLNRFDTMAHVEGRASVGAISTARATQLALGATPMTEAERRLAAAGGDVNLGKWTPKVGISGLLQGADTVAGLKLGRFSDAARSIQEADAASPRTTAAVSARADKVMAAYRGDGTPGEDEGIHESANARALTAMRELSRLKAYGLSPEAALKAYGGFASRHGVAGMTMKREVGMMEAARKAGVSDDLQAEMLRIANLSGEGVGSMGAMTNTLTRGGVMGAPQHGVISAFMQQMAGEQASGMRPSTYVAANAMDAFTQSGVAYPVMPGIRGMASQAVQQNLSIIRDPAQRALQAMMAVNAFKGRTVEEGFAYMGEKDPMLQQADAYNSFAPGMQRFLSTAMAPAQRKEVDEAMKRMKERDMEAAPRWNEEAALPWEASLRASVSLGADWGLVGKERNIGAIEAGQTFKASLDDAANLLRQAADTVATGAIGVTNFLGVTR